MNSGSDSARGSGRFAGNILQFGRLLRDAGLPVGPGSIIDAMRAVEVAGIGTREDFRATLQALFVKKHEHLVVFDQAFRIFWRRRGLSAELAALLPQNVARNEAKPDAEAGATRIAAALRSAAEPEMAPPVVEVDARSTVSPHEVLRHKDFAQMTAEEIAAAERAVERLALLDDQRPARRLVAERRGTIFDPRRAFRRSLRAGGAGIELAWRSPRLQHPPLVAILDISGSMSDYTRMMLRFMHALTARRRRVQTFLFGTRLTNVTRALRARDPDVALSACAAGVEDWSGGTRIAASLHLFNQRWSRRVLAQGATVLLFTDGLERGDVHELAREMERLRKSCRRLIWLNPLLRYDRFAARAQGIRAILPFVDEFRPVHNLASIEDLGRALSEPRPSAARDPARWLRAAE